MRRYLRFVPLVCVIGWILWRMTPRAVPQPEILALVPEPVAESVEGLDAGPILANLAQVYREVDSYRDELWAQSFHVEDGERELWSVEHAELALLRPDKLRWQWRDFYPSRNLGPEYAFLLQDGEHVQVETEHWKRHDPESRGEGVARVSSGRPAELLGLLFPNEVPGRHLLERLTEPRVTKIERFDGHDCYRIEATWLIEGREPTLYTLWVERETGHLRRLFELAPIAEWQLERTVVFTPEEGVTFTDGDFVFDEGF